MAVAAPPWLGDRTLGSTRANVDLVFDRLTDIIFQHAVGTKSKPNPVLASLDLRSLTYHSNMGLPYKAALRASGFEWAPDGKRLWHSSAPCNVLEWKQPLKKPRRYAYTYIHPCRRRC